MTETHLKGPRGFTGWRDTHARVTGEAVPILQTVFATMWNNTTGENLFNDSLFPDVHDGGPAVPVQVVSAGPDSRWEAIRQSYLTMIALADHHVYLQSPFLILDTSVAEALKTAALSGLDVKVMIAPGGAEYSPAYRAGLTYAADMARAGVQVFLYQGAYFHAKTVCVDSTPVRSDRRTWTSAASRSTTRRISWSTTRRSHGSSRRTSRLTSNAVCGSQPRSTKPAAEARDSSIQHCASARRCCDLNS
jgi:hypothetical protein